MKKRIFLAVLVALIGFVAYHYYVKIRDRHIADEVYQQMIVIDGKLDQLKVLANKLHHQKDVNSEVIHGFNELTKDNILEQRSGFIDLVKQIDYDNTVESEILALMESTTDAKSFKNNRKLIKTQLRLLKFDYGKKQEDFNQQISDISGQIKELTGQIQRIDSENLQSLETARLKFISKKLSKTIIELNGSFVDRIIDDVVEKDKISDKDSDGDE